MAYTMYVTPHRLAGRFYRSREEATYYMIRTRFWFSAGVATAAIMLIGCGAAPGERVAPTIAIPESSVKSDKIAFASDSSGNLEIYVMDVDGSNQVLLSNNPAKDFYPSWSPDGGQIVFLSDRDGNEEIYVMDADGTDQTRLNHNMTNDFSPDWSPDGNQLVFTSFTDGDADIYVVNTDGSGLTTLTENQAFDATPSWFSP